MPADDEGFDVIICTQVCQRRRETQRKRTHSWLWSWFLGFDFFGSVFAIAFVDSWAACDMRRGDRRSSNTWLIRGALCGASLITHTCRCLLVLFLC